MLKNRFGERIDASFLNQKKVFLILWYYYSRIYPWTNFNNLLWNCFKHSKDIIILLNRQSPKCYEKDSLWLHTKREASYHNGYIKFLSVLIFKIWQTYLQNISCDKTCPPPPNYYWKCKTLCVANSRTRNCEKFVRV